MPHCVKASSPVQSMDFSRFQTAVGGNVQAMLAEGMGGNVPQSVPGLPPLEPYYEQLFQIADAQSTGFLAGPAAVEFLKKSNLDMAVLKTVWELADADKDSKLSKQEFNVAMSFIALAQSSPGLPLTHERLARETGQQSLPIARMADCPPPPAVAPQVGAAAGGDPWAMSPQDRARYDSLFLQYDGDGDGFMTGQEAVALFSKSGLSRQHLRQVWELADADKDSKLSKQEFNVAMHVIVCVSKKGMPFPTSLPPALLDRPGAAADGSQQSLVQPQFPAVVPPASLQSAAPADIIGDAFSGLDEHSMSTPGPSPAGEAPVASPEADTGGVGAQALVGSSPPVPPSMGAAAAPSQAPPSNGGASSTMVAGGEGASLQRKDSLYSSRGSLASGGSALMGDAVGGDLSSDVVAAGEELMGVARHATTQHRQGMDAQRGSVENLKRLLQKMKQEKVSLGAILEGSQEEYVENERLLEEMGAELETVSTELARLRQQRQEREVSLGDLRRQVQEKAIQRASALAEIEALHAAMDGLAGEEVRLSEEVQESNKTLRAVEGYAQSLRNGQRQEESQPTHANSLPSAPAVPSATEEAFPTFEAEQTRPEEPPVPPPSPPPPPPKPGVSPKALPAVPPAPAPAPAMASNLSSSTFEDGGEDPFAAVAEPFASKPLDSLQGGAAAGAPNAMGEASPADPFSSSAFQAAPIAADPFADGAHKNAEGDGAGFSVPNSADNFAAFGDNSSDPFAQAGATAAAGGNSFDAFDEAGPAAGEAAFPSF